jgi:hypothetical protein
MWSRESADRGWERPRPLRRCQRQACRYNDEKVSPRRDSGRMAWYLLNMPWPGETGIDEVHFVVDQGRHPRERHHGGPISIAGEQQTGSKVPR